MKHSLVCLFRCKLCQTRLFERDAHGHLERHGIAANGDWRTYFIRGRRDTPERPGATWKPLNYGRPLRGGRRAVA